MCSVQYIVCNVHTPDSSGPLWASSWAGLANVDLLTSLSLWCTVFTLRCNIDVQLDALFTLRCTVDELCGALVTGLLSTDVMQCNLHFVHRKQVTGDFCCAFYVYCIPLKQSILVYQECNDESLPSAPLCQFVFIEIKALKPICRDLSNLSRLSALSSFSWFQRRVHNASHPHALVCSGFTEQLDFHIGTVVCTVILGIRKVNDKIWVKSLDKKLKITRFIHVMTWPAGLITRI